MDVYLRSAHERQRLKGSLNEALERESELYKQLVAAERGRERAAELEQAIRTHRKRFAGRTNQVCHDDMDLYKALQMEEVM